MSKKQLVLAHSKSPGDIVAMTGLVRDLQLAYPGEFDVEVLTSAPDLWMHNPHVCKLVKKTNVKRVTLDYGLGIKEQNHETVHFLHYFYRVFKRATGIDVPCLRPHGDLHLSDWEKTAKPIETRYWVMLAGGKSDATVKVWDQLKFQGVVHQLRERGLGVVQLGGTDSGHWHFTLKDTLDLVGKTDLRDMLHIIQHADGVICGVTAAMHMAAALQKPCVVLGGGREAWWWEAYVNENKGFGPKASGKLRVPHRYLHTIGLLDCCSRHGCWKNKVVPLNNDPLLCKYPVQHAHQPVPKCLDLIHPQHVMEAVMSYYTDQTLPPLTPVSPEELANMPPLVVKAQLRGPKPKQVKHPPSEAIQKPQRRQTIPGKSQLTIVTDDVLDHPDVGGRFTIFVLLYGPEQYYEMHRDCLAGIMSTTTKELVDVRVGSNRLNDRSVELIDRYIAEGRISKHYRHPENDYKYPVMREMFHDPSHPIRTKWVIWFDDDSIAGKEPRWLTALASSIVMTHRKDKAHLYGARFTYTLGPQVKKIFMSRPWYRGRPWRLPNGTPSPSGATTVFAAGGWWAITNEAIQQADIPDLGTGLAHNGGDWQIGEQIYQAGFTMKPFNGSKQFIHTSSVPRRGAVTPVPGSGKPR